MGTLDPEVLDPRSYMFGYGRRSVGYVVLQSCIFAHRRGLGRLLQDLSRPPLLPIVALHQHCERVTCIQHPPWGRG